MHLLVDVIFCKLMQHQKSTNADCQTDSIKVKILVTCSTRQN